MSRTITVNENLSVNSSELFNDDEIKQNIIDNLSKSNNIKLEYLVFSKGIYAKYDKISSNMFINIIHHAFNHHHSVVITPDVIKMLITQAFSVHINLDPEKYRELFTDKKEKQTIKVKRDDFIYGSGKNDWSSVIDEFSNKIRANIGEELHDIIKNDFSTTGMNEKICSEIILMETCQEYFKYRLETMCGIRNIILEGTEDDWKKLGIEYENLKKLNMDKNIGLDNWFQKLDITLKEILNAVLDNKRESSFWKSIYHYKEESGHAYITGWIKDFFPYVKDGNKIVDIETIKRKISPDMIMCSTSKAPFIWNYYMEEKAMLICGGIIGANVYKLEDNSITLKPQYGWCIGYQ